MTLYVTRAVGCDYPDCDNEYEGFPGQWADEVRREASARGWRRVRVVFARPNPDPLGWQDRCPTHAVGEVDDTASEDQP